ncbi:ceramidase domain-containing protein [Aurantimonas sp. VKM B-3413]|uniref:ceramidase domain-containing protein n=1 Tax=Aurantimonas sp. VKM B-3413 TaxID=2779401 RepID=UPI001E4BC877|nr:ceramidase domain-containing protein [Aurantimonas sp. VKM B-3413]MCB8837267.1 ceramidase [Aurantimonas sp. VKM B-3413]
MDWSQSVDAYCERTGPAFWAEPVNALSNLAFIIAGLFGLWLLRRAQKHDRPALCLAILVLVIGAGSFTFHTVATRWASLADVLPIAVFIYAYLALALRRFVSLSRLWTGLGTIAFLIASFALEPAFRALVGSSAGYVPALLAMLGIGGALTAQGRSSGGTVLAAGGVFFLSLAFRMLDMPLCQDWPLGTHFLWHGLNAITLALLLKAAINHRPARASLRA